MERSSAMLAGGKVGAAVAVAAISARSVLSSFLFIRQRVVRAMIQKGTAPTRKATSMGNQIRVSHTMSPHILISVGRLFALQNKAIATAKTTQKAVRRNCIRHVL